MNYKTVKSLLSLFAILFFGTSLSAKENIGLVKKTKDGMRATAACAPASSSTELDVNNVRCLLHNGGDMWWDLVSNPRYEVPKVDNPADQRHSSFAGSLWIGGVDEGGQLRVAAQTYRQSGNDFWPGPLTSGGATIDDITCEKWDAHYKITKAEIDAFRAEFNATGTADLSKYPNVEKWPTVGTDSEGNTVPLAPFVDLNGNDIYEPGSGEYPDISPTCDGGGQPDMAVWWVINDKGDVHTETGGEAIGLEIKMLAFAFSTSNEVNNMTFYKYVVTNKSTLTLNETYMGQWVDADIGLYSDDYVGCDTIRGLGFAYNGDSEDEGPSGYGLNPPSLGVDFFQGPKADPLDGIDNDKDGIDEVDELIGMSKFVYYENDFSLRGNPEVATHFYGYLRGFWKDGSAMVNNGQNGYAPTAPGPVTDYMYPGDGGWCGGTPGGWWEGTSNNQPFDRRFLESAGPFTLQPGAVNEIITGAVWARGYYNDNKGSVCELRKADDVAQALFDACFELLDGPDAPELTVTEMDQELVLTWDYSSQACQVRNNCNEGYEQRDPVLVSQGVPDPTFEFEGYMVYQLRDNTVSASEIFDSEKARIVAQCDVENNISTIVNRTIENVSGIDDPVILDEIMVQGANEGIFKSIRLTEDLFAAGTDKNLKNYTTYYYAVVAYAFNDTTSDGRKFVQGNRFFANTSAVPHKIQFENNGTVINSEYGDGIQVTQTAGIGNGNRFVNITSDTENEILAANSASEIGFVAGEAPIDIKVVDPKLIRDVEYRLELVGDQFSGNVSIDSSVATPVIDSVFNDWILYENDGSGWVEVYANEYIKRTQGTTVRFRPAPFNGKEKPIEGHGISVVIEDGMTASDTAISGVIGANVSYIDGLEDWFDGVSDDDDFTAWNWVLAGRNGENKTGQIFLNNSVYDPEEHFENILGGSWSPFCLARSYDNNSGVIGPGLDVGTSPPAGTIDPSVVTNLDNLPDIDIVITPDSSLWSECVVIETSPTQGLGSGAWPMTARWAPSVDQQGNPVAATPTLANQGGGWFPGYAINVTTGERLNVFFGESSWDKQNNGDDMLWNPTAANGSALERVGGRHYIWVHNSPYDGCAAIKSILACSTTTPLGDLSTGVVFDKLPGADREIDNTVYNGVAWVGIPKVNPGFEFDHPRNIPTETRIKLRVTRPFGSRLGTTDYPIFNFSTSDIAAQIGVTDVAEQSVLEQIRVVPNPYYAFSRYESSQLQTLVKFTNLPQKCTIRVFTLNGSLIRTYNKDSNDPQQEWDLKNASGVPVASGVYIIHVDAGDLGEKILKFFAIMPQLDLNAF